MARSARSAAAGSLGRRIVRARWCYLFVLPSLTLSILFTFYPAVASWWISLLDWSGFSSVPVYTGLDNFREVLGDEYFWGAFRRSFIFMFAAVPLQLGISLIVAIVLNDSKLRMAPFFRTMFFIPVVTTAAIVGIVMTFVLAQHNGPVNTALMDLGLIDQPVDFLGNPDLALPTVIGVFVWKWMGLTMIYWLAALQVVPADVYEAARVDGANRWQTHWRITMPLIMPFAAIITLIGAIGALNVFPLIQTLTGGGPFFATEVMEIYIYRTAFGVEGATAPRLGYASAAGVWFGICVMLIALLQGLAARRVAAMRRDLQGGGARS
ncbi:sugar ABC transporter permease [Jiangella asiatica]|uniref:Sugar ABC transporter permease n=1 Tax=Jiangella asiatica TaxID=2530372 RepID=A0A4R5CRE4_9ACTN|nr:sugar ABC transporter permease [Jiangella asiatica]